MKGCKLTKLTSHPRVERAGQSVGGVTVGLLLLLRLRRRLLLLLRRRLLLVASRVRRWQLRLVLVRRRDRRRRWLALGGVQHLLLLLMLHVLMLILVRWGRRLVLVVRGWLVLMGVRHVKRRTSGRYPTPTASAPSAPNCRLQLTAGVNYRCLVAACSSEVATTSPHRWPGPIPAPAAASSPVTHDVPLLLLRPIISSVPNVHSVVRRKSGIRHTLRGLTWSIMMGWHSGTGDDVGVAAPTATLLYGSPVVLVRVLCRNHPSITQVGHVRICEIRTHALRRGWFALRVIQLGPRGRNFGGWNDCFLPLLAVIPTGSATNTKNQNFGWVLWTRVEEIYSKNKKK